MAASKEKAARSQDLGGGWFWDPEDKEIFRADGRFFAVKVGKVGPKDGKEYVQPLVLQEGGDPGKVIGTVTIKVYRCDNGDEMIQVARPWRPGAGREVLEADRSSLSKGEVTPDLSPIGYFRPDSARMTGRVGVVVVRLETMTEGEWMPLPDFVSWTEDGMALAALRKAGL